ncbi:MAG: hypothetical protein IIX91_03975, partial [Clostridia bacterium]|nr:hypothetical protein [Clostridia bacterium]
ADSLAQVGANLRFAFFVGHVSPPLFFARVVYHFGEMMSRGRSEKVTERNAKRTFLFRKKKGS